MERTGGRKGEGEKGREETQLSIKKFLAPQPLTYLQLVQGIKAEEDSDYFFHINDHYTKS